LLVRKGNLRWGGKKKGDGGDCSNLKRLFLPVMLESKLLAPPGKWGGKVFMHGVGERALSRSGKVYIRGQKRVSFHVGGK